MSHKSAYALAPQYRVGDPVAPAAGPMRKSKVSMLQGVTPWRWLERCLRRMRKSPAKVSRPIAASGGVFDLLGDWVCGLDASARITYANAALLRDHPHLLGALPGLSFVDLMPVSAGDTVLLALQRAAITDEPQTCQYETPSAGGPGSWRQWTFQRMSRHAGAALADARFLVIGRDITEQKRLEHQFLHAQRLGSIGMLASGIAHDLNNVLAPITMSADLLKLRGCTQENRSLLDIVATSASRGAGLVSQMLSFTRGLDGNREVVDLGSLVKELSRFIGRTFAKNIQVRMEIMPDLSKLYANPTQIYQVLLNLCVNARDAMPHGGVLKICASNIALDEAGAHAVSGATPGSYAVLAVSDTGIGIPPEIAGRIFDPFFTTKPIGEGTGLGLSTVSSIIKACGGFITLATQVDRGTTFQVYFPVAESALQSPPTAVEVENTHGRGEHVLVADDEEFFRDVTRRLLEDFGYIVHTAADGSEAVKIIEQHRGKVAAALVDLDMPVMNGVAAVKAMKALDPNLRIITVSGSGGSVPPPAIPESDLQLAKPYSVGTLLHSLHQVLAAPAMR